MHTFLLTGCGKYFAPYFKNELRWNEIENTHTANAQDTLIIISSLL